MWQAILPAVIGAGAGIWGAKKAGDANQDALEQAWKMYQQGRTDLAPWRETGESALKELWSRMEAGPGEFKESPGYQFRVGEGEKAIERSAAARGNVLSGATMKGLTRFGQDYATQDYDNFLRRYYDTLNPYQNLSNTGQSSAAQSATQAGNMGQNFLAAGRDKGAQYINMANAVIGNTRGGIKDYLYFKQLNQQPQGGGASNWLGYTGGGYAGNKGVR